MPGTVWYREDFDSGAVAESLRNAMAGFGTDEDHIVRVLGNHTCEQRMEIATAYKTAYGKDLVEDIKDEVSGDFEETCVALLTPFRKLDAMSLKEAMSGAGTDETVLIDVLCTKTNAEIEEIKAVYKEMYETELEEDLVSDTSGYFRRLMVSLMAAGRESDEWFCDEDKAAEDAQKFFDAGEARWGTEEAELNAILCLRSRCQLLGMFRKFEELAGKSIEESIADECSSELQEGYLAIVESTKDMPGYFARRIKDSCAGFGTNDAHLIRIIVSRSEIDMEEIEQAFQAKYGTSVVETIEDECSGHYKKLLIALVTMQE